MKRLLAATVAILLLSTGSVCAQMLNYQPFQLGVRPAMLGGAAVAGNRSSLSSTADSSKTRSTARCPGSASRCCSPSPTTPESWPSSTHIARNFVARTVEVRKVRARRAKLILEVWGRIVLEYIRVAQPVRIELDGFFSMVG